MKMTIIPWKLFSLPYSYIVKLVVEFVHTFTVAHDLESAACGWCWEGEWGFNGRRIVANILTKNINQPIFSPFLDMCNRWPNDGWRRRYDSYYEAGIMNDDLPYGIQRRELGKERPQWRKQKRRVYLWQQWEIISIFSW